MRFEYDGTFPLHVFRDGEHVRSAGDGTGAAIISNGWGEIRVDVGDTVYLTGSISVVSKRAVESTRTGQTDA